MVPDTEELQIIIILSLNLALGVLLIKVKNEANWYTQFLLNFCEIIFFGPHWQKNISCSFVKNKIVIHSYLHFKIKNYHKC